MRSDDNNDDDKWIVGQSNMTKVRIAAEHGLYSL